jgi:WD40-like Beta Propeller Repeat
MTENKNWNWENGKRLVFNINQLQEKYEAVHEACVSPDGEKFAVPVVKGTDSFAVSVNGEDAWEDLELERAWKLQYTTDGRLIALIRVDDEWTVAVDGKPWDDTFDFVWNLKVSADESTICAQVKDGPRYNIASNGETWDTKFHSIRDYAMDSTGKHIAAAAQVEDLAEADIFKFAQGTWSVAVNGKRWDNKFINVWAPTVSPDGTHVAVEARTDMHEYTIAEDGAVWNEKFACVWEPSFRRSGGKIIAPVRIGNDWTLAESGAPIWSGRYVQLWQQVQSPDGKRIAAVVAPKFGQWTIAVDDVPWPVLFASLALPPVFSPDSKRVATGFKDGDKWGIAVDGEIWQDGFDMVWDPVFSNDSNHVAAKVDRGGRKAIYLDGKSFVLGLEDVWDPVFSPDGKQLLIRSIENGRYYRQVVSIDQGTE